MKVNTVLVLCLVSYCFAQNTCTSGNVGCRTGYVPVEDTGCAVSDSSCKCTSCRSGYVLVSDICQPCLYYGCAACSVSASSNNEDKVVCDYCPDATYTTNDAKKCVVTDDKCVQRSTPTSDCTACVAGYYVHSDTKKCTAVTTCADCAKTAHCHHDSCLKDCALNKDDTCVDIVIPYTIADYAYSVTCGPDVIQNTANKYPIVKDTECVYAAKMDECGTNTACCHFYKGYYSSECKACPATVTDLTQSECTQCENNVWIAKTAGGSDYQCEKLNCASQRDRLTAANCALYCTDSYWSTSQDKCVTACVHANVTTEAECTNAKCNGYWVKDDKCVAACPSDVTTLVGITSCNKCGNHYTVGSTTPACETPANYKSNCAHVSMTNHCDKCAAGYYVSNHDTDDCVKDVNADPYCSKLVDGGFFCETCTNTTLVKYTENCALCAVKSAGITQITIFHKIIAVLAVLALTLF